MALLCCLQQFYRPFCPGAGHFRHFLVRKSPAIPENRIAPALRRAGWRRLGAQSGKNRRGTR